MSGHLASCRWIQTSRDECEYVEKHNYCPHSEHACDCLPMSADTPAPDISPAMGELVDKAVEFAEVAARAPYSEDYRRAHISEKQGYLARRRYGRDYSRNTLLAAIADLESRLSAATRDSERLDWLEANEPKSIFRCFDAFNLDELSLREAIDGEINHGR